MGVKTTVLYFCSFSKPLLALNSSLVSRENNGNGDYHLEPLKHCSRTLITKNRFLSTDHWATIESGEPGASAWFFAKVCADGPHRFLEFWPFQSKSLKCFLIWELFGPWEVIECSSYIAQVIEFNKIIKIMNTPTQWSRHILVYL